MAASTIGSMELVHFAFSICWDEKSANFPVWPQYSGIGAADKAVTLRCSADLSSEFASSDMP